jgi:hypothetical protein
MIATHVIVHKMVSQQIAVWCHDVRNVITQKEAGIGGSNPVSYENRNYYK